MIGKRTPFSTAEGGKANLDEAGRNQAALAVIIGQ